MNILNSSYASLQLQSFLLAPGLSFARQHSYGYASSQELIPGTHQDSFHLTERDIR